MQCIKCGDDVEDRRASLGIKLCLTCGDAAAKVARKSWTIAPMHKSNYVLVTNRNDLIGLNNKGGQNRT
jgi:ribosomal protein L37AE/L43A